MFGLVIDTMAVLEYICVTTNEGYGRYEISKGYLHCQAQADLGLNRNFQFTLNCIECINDDVLMHLLETHHNDRFITLMDKYLLDW